MSSARVDEVRKTELLDAPEALERPRLKDAPEDVLELGSLDLKLD